ncbi:MAG TPA: hypothetical protein VGV59_16085 [Pyrinomonadaceae bacterium]|nr:hypothetical protein [Pyrinomonadaceae bacterium]
MKRTQEKIKDLIEPLAFDEVPNVAADPARALAAYRFTDATSDLLARWLDALADLPRGRGAARALAGSRGVGKSHTLAVFGALVASAELRARVDDAHVATSARRLTGRRYTVVRIERGTRATLAEELAAAFSGAFGGEETQWGTDAAQMLAVASSRAGEATLVLLVDTAFGRAARVSRDDGPVLGQLAEATPATGAFVGLALDDDISGADGANVALAATYQIDYLDPEHLYRVADLYVLRKSAQGRDALHDIYLSLRASVPGFNWSEPRFAALYPVHPLVADVAAAVRLYSPTFALLPFAASSAARAASRPALSLVLLDEVFDRAEADLRKAPELADAFVVYDDLALRGVTQLPVMQRLEAKLVLKNLFVLSLDGRGATARELCAALLMSDEAASTAAVERMEATLRHFAEAGVREGATGTLDRVASDDAHESEARYRIGISATAKFDAALEASAARTRFDELTVARQMLALARARFEDWPQVADEHGEPVRGVNFQVAWRGSERPGNLLWHKDASPPPAPNADAQYDWQIVVYAPSLEPTGDVLPAPRAKENAPISVIWRPDALAPEELTALRRLHTLRQDATLVDNFGETARVAAQMLAAQAERIWTRLYINDGALFVDGVRRAFTDRASAAQTLGEALAQILAPHFGARYTEHPLLVEPLGEAEVGRLIDGLFSGTGGDDAEVQHLARVFAEPLGLAARRGGGYALETGDAALGYGWVREVVALVDAADGEVVSIDAVRRALRRPPYGLLRDAQHLVLAALVAQRRVELVTPSGDRISRRTLGRAVKWDEVAGVARAAVIHHDASELTEWARLLTGNAALAPINDPAARASVRAALSEWLDYWRESRLLEHLNALPDAGLTTRIWKTAAFVRKSFGPATEAIEAALATDISLEEGLQRVADAFNGSPAHFAEASAQLAALSGFADGFAERERARAYLSAAEATGVDEIESARRELLNLTADPHNLLDAERRARFDLLWQEFHPRYVEHYARLHERTVGAGIERQALDALLRSEARREFEALSRLPFLNRRIGEEAAELMRRAQPPRCDLPVRQLLASQPSCACSFRLKSATRFANLPRELEALTEVGLAAYRRTLSLFAKHLQRALETLLEESSDDLATAAHARRLAAAFASGELPARFTHADVRLIERALGRLNSAPPVRVRLPAEAGDLVTREELAARLRQWFDDLPDHAALVELSASESDRNAT